MKRSPSSRAARAYQKALDELAGKYQQRVLREPVLHILTALGGV
jgi:hypothetical protein